MATLESSPLGLPISFAQKEAQEVQEAQEAQGARIHCPCAYQEEDLAEALEGLRAQENGIGAKAEPRLGTWTD